MRYLRIGVFSLLLTTSVFASCQTFTALYNFTDDSGCTNGGATLVAQGRDGNLYTTLSNCGANNDGTVVEVTPDGVLTNLHDFNGSDGYLSGSGLTLGSDGNFYGTAFWGGSSGDGTIFQVTPAGVLTVLHNFVAATDGSHPSSGLVQAFDGNLYGVTSFGGGSFCGSFYRVTQTGDFTLLHTFSGPDGCSPVASLIQAADGNFYGTTIARTSFALSGFGNVFKVTRAGVVTVLHNFDGADGATPEGPLVQGTDGKFYGTTVTGGTVHGHTTRGGGGVIFQLTPEGVFAVLHNFDPTPGSVDGNEPKAGLVQAANGAFYGMTAFGGTFGDGTIFKIDGSGLDYGIIYDFDYPTATTPVGTLLQSTNGTFYGISAGGGAATNPKGVFFSFANGLGPFITFVVPTGKVGQTAQILGQGLTGITSVTFNGVPARIFSAISDTYMTAVVPTGATTGPVVVTTPGGTLTSNKNFTISN